MYKNSEPGSLDYATAFQLCEDPAATYQAELDAIAAAEQARIEAELAADEEY